MQRLLLSALTCERPNPRVALFAPTYGQAKRAAWDYAKEMAAPVLAAPPHESELQYRLGERRPHQLLRRRKWRCTAWDLPGRFRARRGCGHGAVVLADRRSTLPCPTAAARRYSSARRKVATSFIASMRPRAPTRPGPHCCCAPVIQDSSVDDELEAARRDLTPEQYEQEYGCSFDAAILGAYYGRELADAQEAGRITSVPYDPALEVHTAWDLGVGDSTAIWFFQISRDGVRVIDYYEASGYGLPHYASVLSARGYTYGTEYLPHDARARQLGTGRSLWETLRSLTNRLPRILPAQNVMDGINAARVTIGSAWFDAEKCHDGLEMLRAYRADYDERTKVFHNRPRHDFSSHGADAFRYLSMAWREMQPEKPPEPPKRDSWDIAFERALSGGRAGDYDVVAGGVTIRQ